MASRGPVEQAERRALAMEGGGGEDGGSTGGGARRVC